MKDHLEGRARVGWGLAVAASGAAVALLFSTVASADADPAPQSAEADMVFGDAEQQVEVSAAEYPVNARGQTYGSLADAASAEDEPDLILAYNTQGQEAYIRATDLQPPEGASDAEISRWSVNREGVTHLPAFESDGITPRGVFAMTNGLTQ